jgi:hypothetical protein
MSPSWLDSMENFMMKLRDATTAEQVKTELEKALHAAGLKLGASVFIRAFGEGQ